MTPVPKFIRAMANQIAQTATMADWSAGYLVGYKDGQNKGFKGISKALTPKEKSNAHRRDPKVSSRRKEAKVPGSRR